MKIKKVGCSEGETKKCRFCSKSDVELMVHCGAVAVNGVTYYSCRPCQAKNKREWYKKAGSKLKQQEYNRRYLLKLKKNK